MNATATRTAKQPVVGRMLLLCALLCAVSGCVSTWNLRTRQPDVPLQWPYQPGAAKVTYLRSLTGFQEQRRTASAMKALFIGRDRKDAGSFVLPVAVATGRDGRIAVADLGRRCVHLYVPSGQAYVRLDGSKGEKLGSPVGVVFDDESRLYVSDSAGKVFAFAPDGRLLFTLKSAEGAPLRRPTGLAYSPARKLVYVVDTLANRVHAFNDRGEVVLSFGERGTGAGGFNFPTHAFWSSGRLYVSDSLNFRIGVFDETGKPLSSFGRHGDGSGDLAVPKGIAVDRDGIIYVADALFDNVQLFDERGGFLLTLGRRGTGFGEMWLPSGIHISDRNELYVCDTYNRRIQVYRLTERYGNGRS